LSTIGVPASRPIPARPLPRDDQALLLAHARTRDVRLRQQLVERYLPLARFAASRFRRSSEPYDDLVQVASIGLIKAIDRFDPENGASFSSYAMPTMVGELRRHFRDRSWTVRPPRDLQEDALKVERATEELRAAHGMMPTVDDVARACALTVESVLEARQALQGRDATSISSAGADDDHPGLEHWLGTDDDGFARAEERATLQRLSAVLTKREREVVRMRFEDDLTQAEIGVAVGVSQMQVSRILRTALEKLRVAGLATA
jgi:RNA polymerase sigma-B factor